MELLMTAKQQQTLFATTASIFLQLFLASFKRLYIFTLLIHNSFVEGYKKSLSEYKFHLSLWIIPQ